MWKPQQIYKVCVCVCVFVQLLGGTFGALLLKWSTPGTMVGSLGTHDLANGIYGGQGLLLEMVLTFVLVFVIFGVAVDCRGPGYQSTTSSENRPTPLSSPVLEFALHAPAL